MIKYETCTYYSVQKKFEKIFRKIINGFEYAGYFKTFFNITIIFDGGKTCMEMATCPKVLEVFKRHHKGHCDEAVYTFLLCWRRARLATLQIRDYQVSDLCILSSLPILDIVQFALVQWPIWISSHNHNKIKKFEIY